jgi:hypothetical protein
MRKRSQFASQFWPRPLPCLNRIPDGPARLRNRPELSFTTSRRWVGANSAGSILVYVIVFTAGASHLSLLTVPFDPRKG